jgi:plasmid stabilization system protein ParE
VARLIWTPESRWWLREMDYPGVRILLYGRYRIVYQRRSDENVYVLGVFHGALDLKRHLRLTGHEDA